MLGPAGKIAGIYDRIQAWASKPRGNGVTPIDQDDVKRSLGEIHSIWRVNELLNWQVASSGDTVEIADAAATKVFSTERIQRIGRLAEEIVAKYGNPAEEETAEVLQWLDSHTKRNLVITFGGGVNEVMREQVAAAGHGDTLVHGRVIEEREHAARARSCLVRRAGLQCGKIMQAGGHGRTAAGAPDAESVCERAGSVHPAVVGRDRFVVPPLCIPVAGIPADDDPSLEC
jgi:hypothetical protein